MSAQATCHACQRPLPASSTLTTKQAAVLGFVSAYIAREGVAPTCQVIADHFGYRSLATVSEHLETLERKGYIQRTGEAQGIALVLNPSIAVGRPFSVARADADADAQPARLQAVHS